MKKNLLKLNRFANSENTVESLVCFKKFFDFLEAKAGAEKGLRAQFLRMVLDSIRNQPNLIAGVPVAEAAGYQELFELVAGIAVPLIDNQDEALFGIRRRIPRILAQCDSRIAIQGLLAGLSDIRFEVRFQCARALDSLVQRRPDLNVPASAIFAAVERELQVVRPIRDSRRSVSGY